VRFTGCGLVRCSLGSVMATP